MIVQVKRIDGSCFSVEADPQMAIEDFKSMIAVRADIPRDQQRLVYRGQLMRDGTTLSGNLIQENSIIHLIRQTIGRPGGPVSQSSASPGTLASSALNLASFQQHLMSNPDTMQQMLNSPAMQALLGNPDVMRSIINMNPQMKNLMESNPEIASLLNDPDFLSRSMEAVRNPSIMREMMRNTDRAMGNIESIPGGFQALQKMYSEIQEPLWQATSGGHSSATSAAPVNYSNQSTLGPNNQPLPNPWGAGGPGGLGGAAPAGSAIPANFPFGALPASSLASPPFDPSAMAAMLQDPNMQQLMASMFKPPTAQPSSQATAQPNSQAATPFANPNFIGSLFDPSLMTAMGALQSSLPSLPGGSQPGNFSGAFSDFTSAMTANPEVRFRSQLHALRGMGFTDVSANIRALQSSNGNVNRAIDILIGDAQRTIPDNNK